MRTFELFPELDFARFTDADAGELLELPAADLEPRGPLDFELFAVESKAAGPGVGIEEFTPVAFPAFE